MTGPRNLFAVGLVAALVSALPAAADPPETLNNRVDPIQAGNFSANLGAVTPMHLAQALLAAQERVVLGEASALADYQVVVRALNERVDALDPKNWDNPRNRRALLIFAFGGGSPGRLPEIVSRGSLEPTEKILFQAAVALIRGEHGEGAELLRSVVARSLGAPLGARVALATALVWAAIDADVALEACDEAVLLSPGTLVEESALRVAVQLAIQTGDESRFLAAASRHIRRFSASPFSGVIDSRIAAVLAARDGANSLFRALSAGPGEGFAGTPRRHALLQRVAEAALGSGNFDLAVKAARAVVAHKPPTEKLAAALAIEGTAALLSRQREAALEKLDTVEKMVLDERSAKIASIARLVDRYITSPPMELNKLPLSVNPTNSPAVLTRAELEFDERMKRVSQRIDAVSKVLAEAP